MSFPLCRNGLSQPLDSGLRRAAAGILGGLFPTPLYHLRPVGVPSRRIPDFLSINDGGGWGQAFARHGRGVIRIATNPFQPPWSFQRRLAYRDVGGRAVSGTHGRGIQEGGDAMVKEWQILPDGTLGCRACFHSCYAGMACLNHWIPACACLPQAGRNDRGGCGQEVVRHSKGLSG